MTERVEQILPARASEALKRAEIETPNPAALGLLDPTSSAALLQLGRDICVLGQLLATEKNDREAIRAVYETRITEIRAALTERLAAIDKDFRVFDALRQDTATIVKTLLDAGHLEQAIALQREFLQTFSGSALDKIAR